MILQNTNTYETIAKQTMQMRSIRKILRTNKTAQNTKNTRKYKHINKYEI